MTKKSVYIKPLKNSTLPYLNEIPPRVIHEKTKGYDVIGVDVFRLPLMKSLPKKRVNSLLPILLSSALRRGSVGQL